MHLFLHLQWALYPDHSCDGSKVYQGNNFSPSQGTLHTNTFVPRGNLELSIHQLACLWEGGGNPRSQRNSHQNLRIQISGSGTGQHGAVWWHHSVCPCTHYCYMQIWRQTTMCMMSWRACWYTSQKYQAGLRHSTAWLSALLCQHSPRTQQHPQFILLIKVFIFPCFDVSNCEVGLVFKMCDRIHLSMKIRGIAGHKCFCKGGHCQWQVVQRRQRHDKPWCAFSQPQDMF